MICVGSYDWIKSEKWKFRSISTTGTVFGQDLWKDVLSFNVKMFYCSMSCQRRYKQDGQMLECSIFTLLTGHLRSYLLDIINHCKRFNYFIPLYNRMTAQVPAFHLLYKTRPCTYSSNTLYNIQVKITSIKKKYTRRNSIKGKPKNKEEQMLKQSVFTIFTGRLHKTTSLT